MALDDLEPGYRFDDRYAILSKIGGGSFGVVYSAFDHVRGREVALKVLREHARRDTNLVERFEREAEICGKLTNPHTARLHGFAEAAATDEHGEMPYMVFDLVRGLPLGVLLRYRHTLEVDETAHILIGILESLEEAHQQGIIHRDLKPDNVLCVPPAGSFYAPQASGKLHQILGVPPLGDRVWDDLSTSWVRVVDFGLGKILEIDDRRVKPLTKAGMAAGTANYMSPEQLQAQPIDYRSDIYGAGMLLHRLLAGRETYLGKTVAEVAVQHIQAELPALPEPYTEHPIAEVFARAGAKAKEDRYSSAAEMAHDLRIILDPTLADLPRPDFPPPPEVRREGLTNRVKRMLKG